MSKRACHAVLVVSLFALMFAATETSAGAQGVRAPDATAAVVLTGAELTRVVPPGFYFEGQSAPTQARNSAAARFPSKRHVIAGMVDTAGYSSDIRAKYEGFFITDAPIIVGGGMLPTGAYGFGFTDAGQFNIFDVGGTPLMSVQTTNDTALTRPRPLMMLQGRDGLRLYSGRRYVLIATRSSQAEL